MPLYSAAQIIGKTLYAVTDVPIKRDASDGAATVYTVRPGQPVGVVYSWLDVSEKRSTLYWMFYDANNRPYFAAHKVGRFSQSALNEQGAITVKEQVEADKKKNESAGDKIERLLKYALGVVAVVVIGKSVVDASIRRKNTR